MLEMWGGKLTSKGQAAVARKVKSHKIDDIAQQILHDVLDEISYQVKFVPDYGIDFRVQLLDKEDFVSHKVCLVQSKGTESIKHISKHKVKYIRHVLRKDRLDDYLNVYQTEPVFLIIVDVVRRVGYYQFMQKYPDSGLLTPDWTRGWSKGDVKSTITVYVPESNRISKGNTTSFLNDIDAAILYMKKKYPGTVVDAIRYKENEYARIDPRFSVSFEYREGKLHESFKAIEPASGKIVFKCQSDEQARRVMDVIDRGLPARFNPEELQVVGLPLMDRVRQKGPVVIQCAKKQQVLVSLVRVAGDNVTELGRIDGLQGEMVSGKREFALSAELTSSVLRIEASGGLNPGDNIENKFTLVLNWKTWLGKPVQSLQHFSGILLVLGADMLGHPLRLEIHYPSSDVCVLAAQISQDEGYFKRVALLLEAFQKMQEISRFIGSNFVIPAEGLMKEHFENIWHVYNLLFNCPAERDSEEARVDMVLGKSIGQCPSKGEVVRDVCLESEELLSCLDGSPVLIGRSKRVFSMLEVVDIRKGDTGTTELSLAGLKGSVMKLTLTR